MTSVFIICLTVGAVLSIAMAVLGGTHGLSSHAHHVGGHHAAGGHHVGGHHGAGGHHASGSHHGTGSHHAPGGSTASGAAIHALVWGISWFSPLTLGGFLLLFGGVGLLAGSGTLAIVVAVICGLLGAVAIRALLAAFVRASSPGISSTAEGAIGRIVSTVGAGGTGEVSYRLEGLDRTVICVAENRAMPIPRGTEVVITRREGGYAYVEPLDMLDAPEP